MQLFANSTVKLHNIISLIRQNQNFAIVVAVFMPFSSSIYCWCCRFSFSSFYNFSVSLVVSILNPRQKKNSKVNQKVARFLLYCEVIPNYKHSALFLIVDFYCRWFFLINWVLIDCLRNIFEILIDIFRSSVILIYSPFFPKKLFHQTFMSQILSFILVLKY